MYYDGNRFPNWLTEMDPLSSSSSSLFPYLVKLFLYSLHRCESLPLLGQLPSLKRLHINGMSAIRRIGREFYGDDAAATFSSLKYLMLYNLPNLEEWLIVPERDMFPSLEHLIIWGCPKLTVQPCLPSSILELQIVNSNEELLAAGGSLQGLSRLRKLEIGNMKASKSGWEGLQYLTALQELNISYCEELTCLPEGIMQQHFPSLRTMTLDTIPNLMSLGEGGEEPPLLFTSLHHLTISYCDALTALPEWVGGLTSLQYLTIKNCYDLAMLPHGLRRLTGLYQLTIIRCPILKRRYEREKGEDWHKIAHIPYIDLR